MMRHPDLKNGNTWLMLVACLALVCLAASPALSILPPEVYVTRSENSAIKGIATIQSVTDVDIGPRYTTKCVTFAMEYSLVAGGPATFTGTCKSRETPEQRANQEVGGTIYYTPKEGERVFVTVSHDSGSITTLTAMTPQLEKIVRTEPSRLVYGMGGVSFR